MPAPRPPSIGLIIDSWDGDHLIVSSTKPDTPAAKGGFRPGDTVTSIGGMLPMEFLESPLRASLARVEVMRDGAALTLFLEFPDPAPAAAGTPGWTWDDAVRDAEEHRWWLGRRPEADTMPVTFSGLASGTVDTPMVSVPAIADNWGDLARPQAVGPPMSYRASQPPPSLRDFGARWYK